MAGLFDEKLVRFMWTDKLKGKKVFVADNINSLIERVEKGASTYEVHWSKDKAMPFEREDFVRYHFAYYDPNYSIKRAFNEGKKIQIRDLGVDSWRDCDEPQWSPYCGYRVKPEEEKWIAYLARASFKGKDCHLTACKEDAWEMAQEEFAAKTKLFVGAEDEVVEWYKPRRKFAEVIKAWEDGKQIQCRQPIISTDWINTPNPNWDVELEYRVKPDCLCEDGIDSKACVGCEHSEDGKPHPFENYHCYGCYKSSKKKYRPYESSAEMIADFIDRFNVKCPSYCEPLIWVKDKQLDCRYLITAFMPFDVEIGSLLYKFKQLFDEYTYLDGSPCGKRVGGND